MMNWVAAPQGFFKWYQKDFSGGGTAGRGTILTLGILTLGIL